VVSTRVGYAGGSKKNPTYRDLGDHTETVQIEFDPRLITYRDLLEVFWKSHDPTAPRSNQYRSLILFHNEEQKRLATESREREQSRRGETTTTVIAAFSEFFPAEAYHQKYWLRQVPGLMNELRSLFSSDEVMVASTVAARLNGYLGGHGSIEAVEKSVPGVSAKIWRMLDRIAGSSLR
jgi:peptide-methionine (S)-S-oxide reductase